MEKTTIKLDDGSDVVFKGYKIAHASSSDNSDFLLMKSSLVGRWTEYTLYITDGNQYVCSKINRTRWQGEQDVSLVKTCQTTQEVIHFLGDNWLADQIYLQANITQRLETS